MSHEIALELAGWFPLLFLTVFGFIALIWSALLTTILLNVLRTFGTKPDAVEPMDATAEPVPPQPDQRSVSKRSRASFPKPMPASGTAHDHSLPPYISMN